MASTRCTTNYITNYTTSDTTNCTKSYTTLVIGDERLNITAISHKLLLDIALLQERITTLSAHASANTLVLNTYKEMLDSRRSVLAWLSGYQHQHASAHLKPLAY